MEDKRNLLEDQIEEHLKKMKTFDPGSEEMGKATRELDTLYKLAQEADADKRKRLFGMNADSNSSRRSSHIRRSRIESSLVLRSAVCCSEPERASGHS